VFVDEQASVALYNCGMVHSSFFALVSRQKKSFTKLIIGACTKKPLNA
jgi:hypothetical protein